MVWQHPPPVKTRKRKPSWSSRRKMPTRRSKRPKKWRPRWIIGRTPVPRGHRSPRQMRLKSTEVPWPHNRRFKWNSSYVNWRNNRRRWSIWMINPSWPPERGTTRCCLFSRRRVWISWKCWSKTPKINHRRTLVAVWVSTPARWRTLLMKFRNKIRKWKMPWNGGVPTRYKLVTMQRPIRHLHWNYKKSYNGGTRIKFDRKVEMPTSITTRPLKQSRCTISCCNIKRQMVTTRTPHKLPKTWSPRWNGGTKIITNGMMIVRTTVTSGTKCINCPKWTPWSISYRLALTSRTYPACPPFSYREGIWIYYKPWPRNWKRPWRITPSTKMVVSFWMTIWISKSWNIWAS